MTQHATQRFRIVGTGGTATGAVVGIVFMATSIYATETIPQQREIAIQETQ